MKKLGIALLRMILGLGFIAWRLLWSWFTLPCYIFGITMRFAHHNYFKGYEMGNRYYDKVHGADEDEAARLAAEALDETNNEDTEYVAW